MKNTYTLFFLLFCFWAVAESTAQVNITVDFHQTPQPYSKYIFGKNNTLNSLSGNSGIPSASEWTKINDSGITVFRENGGNNSTKYNWKTKLSSHPNWYNNVYPNDWDHLAGLIADELAGRKAVFGFQLTGKVAASKDHNFNDWGYNQSKWWSGVDQNLAGGGTLNPDGGGKALIDGDPTLYTKDWPADSTVGILHHWFNDLAYDPDQFQYWCMDNEPEIWEGTHDDVVSTSQTAEQFMQLYFQVAKKARAAYPSIKLVGPITANEWQWYNWHNQRVGYNGTNYNWLEYFILRVSEEQKATGIRLLDVLSLHHYPSSTDVEKVMQYHRIFYDENYVYPEANGVKAVNGGWDSSINKEYIFKRTEDWLNKYLGTGHGVTLGMTETGVAIKDPDAVAVWYTSTLGEFMKHNVELFTPWGWEPAMWEVVHLFTNYSFDKYQAAVSDNEELVSAYVTTNADSKNATAILVNRSTTTKQKVNLKFKGKYPVTSTIVAKQLDKLPSSETFLSHSQNALKPITVTSGASSISVTMEPLSIVVLTFETTTELITGVNGEVYNRYVSLYPNPCKENQVLNFVIPRSDVERIEIYNSNGIRIRTMDSMHFVADGNGTFMATIETQGMAKGLYIISSYAGQWHKRTKLIIY